MANGLKPRTMKPVAGIIELLGQKVSTSKSGQNLVLNNVPGYAQGIIVPAGLGLKEGEELIGDATIVEVTYYEDGTPEHNDLATPIVRNELAGFTSLAAQAKADKLRNEMKQTKAIAALETAIIASKAAAVADIQWSSKDFSFGKMEIASA